MNPFKIIPISQEYASHIRKKRKDDFGHKVLEQISTGFGPCRVSLKSFVPNRDTRLVLTHSPFEINNVYNQPGPVFIHKEEVEEYRDVHRFPPEIKADNMNFPLTLVGYSSDQRMNFTQRVGNDDVDELISWIFKNHSEVEFLHARNSEACCFICKIERI
jgi:hypothetical protein